MRFLVSAHTSQQEGNGTSIVDVTNPKQPKYLAHIPGESGAGESGGAQMVRVCDGGQLPRADKSKVYLLRTLGNHGHEIWDVTDPSKPTRLTVVVSGLRATHKNWWECDTGIAYLVSGPPGWRTDRMTQIYDLSDPVTPDAAGKWQVSTAGGVAPRWRADGKELYFLAPDAHRGRRDRGDEPPAVRGRARRPVPDQPAGGGCHRRADHADPELAAAGEQVIGEGREVKT